MVTCRRGWAAGVADSASALTRPATTTPTATRLMLPILPALSRSRCRLSAVTARLGVDIGGTFTDLVVIDETSGAARVGKVLTTPKDPAHAVEQGIGSLLEESAIPAGAVRAVVHGTTLATNALIERKGARTALLTTEGFRDALEIRHEGRYDMYDLFIDPPAPLVPRRLRREVRERLLADGEVRQPLDEDAARRVIGELAAEGVEAVAICLMHAYMNPAHERRLAALVREIAPQMVVACASEVVPEIREYERTSTTTANVYVAPLMSRYLDDLERRLAEREIPGQLYIMQSSGGIALPPLARRLPIRLVESGPPPAPWPPPRPRASAASRSFCRSTWAARPPRRASSTTVCRLSGVNSRWRAPTASRRARGCRSACR